MPTYETEQDRKNELKVGSAVADKLGYRATQMPRYSPWDFELFGSDKLQGIVEVKYKERIRFGQFDDVYLDLSKWVNCLEKAKKNDYVPFWLAVRFKNGIYMTETDIPIPIGCTREQRDGREEKVLVLRIGMKTFQPLSYFEQRPLW